jgi:L-asparaginase/Glu-tRNA(Gln) amidotransferase subunit D
MERFGSNPNQTADAEEALTPLRRLRADRCLIEQAAPGLWAELERAQEHHVPLLVESTGFGVVSDVALALLRSAHTRGITVIIMPRLSKAEPLQSSISLQDESDGRFQNAAASSPVDLRRNTGAPKQREL